MRIAELITSLPEDQRSKIATWLSAEDRIYLSHLGDGMEATVFSYHGSGELQFTNLASLNQPIDSIPVSAEAQKIWNQCLRSTAISEEPIRVLGAFTIGGDLNKNGSFIIAPYSGMDAAYHTNAKTTPIILKGDISIAENFTSKGTACWWKLSPNAKYTSLVRYHSVHKFYETEVCSTESGEQVWYSQNTARIAWSRNGDYFAYWDEVTRRINLSERPGGPVLISVQYGKDDPDFDLISENSEYPNLMFIGSILVRKSDLLKLYNLPDSLKLSKDWTVFFMERESNFLENGYDLKHPQDKQSYKVFNVGAIRDPSPNTETVNNLRAFELKYLKGNYLVIPKTELSNNRAKQISEALVEFNLEKQKEKEESLRFQKRNEINNQIYQAVNRSQGDIALDVIEKAQSINKEVLKGVSSPDDVALSAELLSAKSLIKLRNNDPEDALNDLLKALLIREQIFNTDSSDGNLRAQVAVLYQLGVCKLWIARNSSKPNSNETLTASLNYLIKGRDLFAEQSLRSRELKIQPWPCSRYEFGMRLFENKITLVSLEKFSIAEIAKKFNAQPQSEGIYEALLERRMAERRKMYNEQNWAALSKFCHEDFNLWKKARLADNLACEGKSDLQRGCNIGMSIIDYLIKDRQFKEAVKSSKKLMNLMKIENEKFSESNLKANLAGLNLNYAHALLLSGDQELALKVYRENREEYVNGQSFIKCVENDFKDYRKLGIEIPNEGIKDFPFDKPNSEPAPTESKDK